MSGLIDGAIFIGFYGLIVYGIYSTVKNRRAKKREQAKLRDWH